MASLCHPWFTTTSLSYRFPIFETSATALCGTTGKQDEHNVFEAWSIFASPQKHILFLLMVLLLFGKKRKDQTTYPVSWGVLEGGNHQWSEVPGAARQCHSCWETMLDPQKTLAPSGKSMIREKSVVRTILQVYGYQSCFELGQSLIIIHPSRRLLDINKQINRTSSWIWLACQRTRIYP